MCRSIRFGFYCDMSHSYIDIDEQHKMMKGGKQERCHDISR